MVHPRGELTIKDLVSILPMLDDMVIIEASGKVILDALENAVCMWPKLEGRFLQVSGVRFQFDGSKDPGSRVVADSVEVSGEPLDLEKMYRLCTKQYLSLGKDGFDCFADCKVRSCVEVSARDA